ncbi:nucleotidyltransferase family protein [Cytobacillus sp. S13-E01]|uniref:nucleotidyltransferase domain-containing protein n=1 Tax=Cytobacillus sp. S13-E01 TaxID=3031326 RepID=UPI0023D8305C|nr:nucleotidyltransferase family protein [Cytobacillus sp. S13-E01]MDF0727751.1 nucleotidyltransferase family protein [Cytobacillus sp. S13-E01]
MAKSFTLNLNQIPKELKLIMEIIKYNHNINKEYYEDIDWNKFLELAIHHRVYPILYPTIKKIDNKVIPSYVIQKLSEVYKSNIFQMLHLSSEISQVSKLFKKEGVNLLVLKGPVLATDLYGDISLRTCGDLDVLIQIEDLDKVEELLNSIGYIKDDYIKSILNDWKWRHHHVTYINHSKQIKLEIHWRLNPGPSKEPSFSEMWERKREITNTGYPFYCLGREDLFLFLVSHGARHGWSRLRWLIDIDQITRQSIDWEKLTSLMSQNQYIDVGGQALILASELLNTPIGKDMRTIINGKRSYSLAEQAIFYIERMVNLHSEPIPNQIARYHKRHLFSLMSIQQKFLFILSFLYPYPEDAENLPLPNRLHFLYFPLRPFLWVWRKTSKHVISRGI